MPSFDFDSVVDRRATGSLKWDIYGGRDVIPLWVADMDFRSPPAVVEALRRRVEHGIYGYTVPPEELVAAVRDAMLRDHDWYFDADELVWIPGLVTGLNIACRAVGEAGDDVLTMEPVYPPFFTAPTNGDRRTIRIPLHRVGGCWQWDPDELTRSITPRTRILLLCSPHNPTGRVWSRKELEQVAEISLRHDLIVCSDEIHSGLVLDGTMRHIPFSALGPEIARRTITLQAPSKTFNIPGLGCSFAVIGNDGLRRRFKAAMAGIVPHVNLFGLTAAAAAYREGEPWRQALIDRLRLNRDLVTAAIAGMPGLAMIPGEATCLAWIDARQTGIETPTRFFEEAGVGLSDGAAFGRPGFVRLNFGCPESLLREALGRMTAALRCRRE